MVLRLLAAALAVRIDEPYAIFSSCSMKFERFQLLRPLYHS
jgi:hypothetical protein